MGFEHSGDTNTSVANGSRFYFPSSSFQDKDISMFFLSLQHPINAPLPPDIGAASLLLCSSFIAVPLQVGEVKAQEISTGFTPDPLLSEVLMRSQVPELIPRLIDAWSGGYKASGALMMLLELLLPPFAVTFMIAEGTEEDEEVPAPQLSIHS